MELIFYPAEGGSDFSSRLFDFLKSLELESKGALKVAVETEGPLPGKPGFTISRKGRRDIHYMALPAGPEAPPFTEALSALIQDEFTFDADWAGKLEALEEPAEVFVFMASECPYCPGSVGAAIRIALAGPWVNTTIIDAQQFPELCERFGVRSVPVTVLDRGLSMVGVVKEEALVDHLLSRGSEAFEQKVFTSLVEMGRFGDAAATIKEGRGAQCFLEAWRGSTTSLRIGLLLASEEAMEDDGAALDGLVPGLLPFLDSEDATMRGDTTDLLGRIGHASAVEKIEELLADPNPDVAEIAYEVLDEIRTGGKS